MANASEFEKILPCDTERPYAFISYSHRDSDYVWADAIAFQQMGYNIWIDRNVNATEERSWNDATRELITNINCRMILFYTSKNSVISEPCLNELLAAKSDDARNTHLRKPVPVVKIDVNPIQNLAHFEQETHSEILGSTCLSSEEKSAKVICLSQVMDICFPDGNSTVRMLSRNDPKREREYYQELRECFQKTYTSQFTTDGLYLRSIQLLQDKAQHPAVLRTLDYCTNNGHPYAPLLLAYLLKTGACGMTDTDQANLLLMFESAAQAGISWLDQAVEKKAQGKREEAVALYLAHGMMHKAPDAFLTACKLWFNMTPRNYELAEYCLLDARTLGSTEASSLLRGLTAHKNQYQNKS